MQSTVVSSSHRTPPRPLKPLSTSRSFQCCPPAPHAPPGRSGTPFLLPPLSSPETRPAAAFHLHPCPPLQGRGAHTGTTHPGIHPPPGLFLTPAPAPGPPYPHSRGSQARVLPGRSGGRTGTSPPPPPNGCKSKLLREREERPSVTWPCHVPTQRPHGVPWHLPPAVRRPPATASPLADRPLPSLGDTYRGSTRTGGQDPIPFAPHPETLLPPSLPCQWQYTHVHTHPPPRPGSPILQEPQ